MRLRSALAAGLVAVTAAFDGVAAGFTNSFDNITSGSTITLAWQEGDVAQAKNNPLCIEAHVIERNGDGYSANAYRVNLTTTASGTSFAWTSAPYPLRWIQGGLYQLELRPATWDGPNVPVLARSPHFSISAPAPSSTSTPEVPPTSNSDDSGSGSISTPVAIGVGVAIGVPSVAATAFLTWRMRKRKRQAELEKQKLKRSEFVIS